MTIFQVKILTILMNEWETGITNPLILHLESEKQEKIKGVESQLSALNPISVLNRGYALVTKNTGNTLIKKTEDIEVLDDIDIHISDGILRGKITEKPS